MTTHLLGIKTRSLNDAFKSLQGLVLPPVATCSLFSVISSLLGPRPFSHTLNKNLGPLPELFPQPRALFQLVLVCFTPLCDSQISHCASQLHIPEPPWHQSIVVARKCPIQIVLVFLWFLEQYLPSQSRRCLKVSVCLVYYSISRSCHGVCNMIDNDKIL